MLGAACGVMITGMRITFDTIHVPDSPLIRFVASHNPKVGHSIYKGPI